MSRSTPPAADEFEISIIGPGRGESVILHVGNNQWCIVDSCIAAGSSEAAAVEYLDNFHNNALNSVKIVLATHWHDDHIHGLASIMRKVPGASFFCSAALNSDNFFVLAEVAPTVIQGKSGLDEFAAIFGSIAENALTKDAKKLASPKWVTENRNLLTLPRGVHPYDVTVTALSPSDGTITLAIQELAKLIPNAGEQQRRISNRSPNHNSIVLWIEAGPVTALLGADLENTGKAGDGWTAVLQCHKDGGKARSASFIKVPHHGSKNADCAGVWTQMVTENPIAVVTPYNGGRTPLPRESDLNRLAGRTSRLYCTSGGTGKGPARDNLVERKMKEQLADRRIIEGQPGHVRVRWQPNRADATPVIETFHAAYKV